MIRGPDPIHLEGRPGTLYQVHSPFEFTGHAVVDEQLSRFPVAVFVPPGRDPRHTPLVIGLQGMAAPYQWNGFIVPTLLDMGLAVILFDTPMGGERSLARSYDGDAIREVSALLEHGAQLQPSLLPRMMDAVANDFAIVLRLAEERHGLSDARRALFGVSLGTLLSSFAFARDRIGLRLLGTIGHADLPLFARSYAPPWTPWLVWAPVQATVGLVGWVMGSRSIPGTFSFLAVLHEMGNGGDHCSQANPMAYLDRVEKDRRVRFLVGGDDPVVRTEDALACAARFPDGECYVVPGLAHGGGDFVEHVRTFLGTQLGDWKW
jgi:hypothetical protein